MRGPAARAADPSGTVVERTIISVLHDIALAFLVAAQITVAVVFRVLNLLINTGPILNHMAPTLILGSITRTVKSVIMIFARPFVAFFRSIDAFCTAVYTDPSSSTYFICSGGFLFVTTWLSSRIGWECFYPIVWMLFEVVILLWLVVSVWGAVAFLRYQWGLWGGMGRQQKRKPKPSVQENLTASKDPRNRGPPKPEPLDLSSSFHARDYLDLDDDPNRNWSNEHGNLSPREAEPISPLRRWFAGIIKDLDDDSNRNWSNEHGNLSPEFLGRGYDDDTPRCGTTTSCSSAATITPNSSASASSDHNKLNMAPATTSTLASRDTRIFTPTTASTSGSILTPSETASISKEEFYRLLGVELSQTSLRASTGPENRVYGTRVFTPASTQSSSSSATSKAKHTPATSESDKTSEKVYTPSSALAAGRFDIADHLRGDYGEYLDYLAQISPTSSDTGSDVTAIYTPATTGSITSSSQSEMDGVMYTPSSTTASGSTVIYAPSSAGT